MVSPISNWKNINWLNASVDLKRLQAKLYEALKLNYDHSKIQRIHNEILNSFAARAWAVRKVTSNKGRKTRGVDNILWTTDEQKHEAVLGLKIQNGWANYVASPVRRAWIPKNQNTKELRPLGIPTIKDRAVQCLWNYILDVHQEHTANPRSFGFRIGRSPKQAINYAWTLGAGAGKRKILKVDIRKAYDRVNHDWLLKNLPINKLVLKQWIKAGIIDRGKTEYPEMGVPQGGPISPTIFNFVMNGVEHLILTRSGGFPIRFADDLIVFGNSDKQLEKAKEVIIDFLKPRGLELNESKTINVSIENGIDILGYHYREYSDITRVGKKGKPNKQGIVLAKPSNRSIENFKMRIRNEMKKLKYTSAIRVIIKLNPIIKGWANYFNAGGGWTIAKKKLGYWIFKTLLKWVKIKHKGKGKGILELMPKYFKGVQRRKTHQNSYFNKWTFFGTDANKKEVLLTDIQEIKVQNENHLCFDPSLNPYNPDSYDEFDKAIKRRIKREILLSKEKQRLLARQDGVCTICGEIVDLNLEEAERDHIVAKVMGGDDTQKNLRVVHKTCHDQKTAWDKLKRSNKKFYGNIKPSRIK